jgi:hypothetical protein
MTVFIIVAAAWAVLIGIFYIIGRLIERYAPEGWQDEETERFHYGPMPPGHRPRGN